MRVFLTGASGFVGAAVAQELTRAGRQVVALARSDESAAKLEQAGYEVARGDLEQPDSLAAHARAADATIHCAFDHDFSQFMENIAKDRRNIEAMAAALAGSGKPLIITSGAGVLPGRVSTEEDAPDPNGNPRILTETVITEAATRGLRGIIIRLPQVHDRGDRHGFTPHLIATAREKGFAAYIGDGGNRWSAVHRPDLARLYVLALEKAMPGTRLNGVAEGEITTRALAEAIGAGTGLPVRSITPAEAQAYYGWMAMFVGMDMPVSSALTREWMGWEPTGPGLIEDLRTGDYFA